MATASFEREIVITNEEAVEIILEELEKDAESIPIGYSVAAKEAERRGEELLELL